MYVYMCIICIENVLIMVTRAYYQCVFYHIYICIVLYVVCGYRHIVFQTHHLTMAAGGTVGIDAWACESINIWDYWACVSQSSSHIKFATDLL